MPVMTTEERHANHHRLIADRKAALDALPKKGNGAVRSRQREAYKKYWWTLTGHIRSHHRDAMSAARLNPSCPFLNLTRGDVESMHEHAH